MHIKILLDMRRFSDAEMHDYGKRKFSLILLLGLGLKSELYLGNSLDNVQIRGITDAFSKKNY